MNSELLEKLIVLAVQGRDESQSVEAADVANATIEEARAELKRILRTSIADDPITMMESEIKALGWKATERETSVEYLSPDNWFIVRFHVTGKIELIGLQSLESEEPAGVKTVDDLLDLLFRLTGRRQSR